MKYRTIPGTPLKPSVLCLGTAHFGTSISETEAFRMMDAFTGMGGNFLDTANVYGDWAADAGKSASEKTIGKWLKRRGGRDRIVIGTKGAHPRLETLHVPRLSPEAIRFDLEQSLSHLQTDYIDLYWLHQDNPAIPVGEIMDVLNDLLRRGTIRAFGCSNWTAPRIAEAQDYAERRGLRGFAANQMMWNLGVPNETFPLDNLLLAMDADLERLHLETGLAAIPYNAQAYGFFSGRYAKDDPPVGKLVHATYYSEENFRRLERVKRVARERKRSNTEIALAYLLSQPFPVFPIIGASNIGQLRESCRAGAGDLLDEATVRYLRYGNGSADPR